MDIISANAIELLVYAAHEEIREVVAKAIPLSCGTTSSSSPPWIVLGSRKCHARRIARSDVDRSSLPPSLLPVRWDRLLWKFGRRGIGQLRINRGLDGISSALIETRKNFEER